MHYLFNNIIILIFIFIYIYIYLFIIYMRINNLILIKSMVCILAKNYTVKSKRERNTTRTTKLIETRNNINCLFD